VSVVHVQELGHVVVKVRDAQRAEAFYGGVLGIPAVGRVADPVPMIFFTLGHHHDFAVMELGQHGPSPDRHAAGLAHVAFKIGDSLEAFDAAKHELESAGVVILFELKHRFSRGCTCTIPTATKSSSSSMCPARRRCARDGTEVSTRDRVDGRQANGTAKSQ
jgi:catechol 2,3-dioxygenase-like lactoylglutathione lyase family enzyme